MGARVCRFDVPFLDQIHTFIPYLVVTLSPSVEGYSLRLIFVTHASY